MITVTIFPISRDTIENMKTAVTLAIRRSLALLFAVIFIAACDIQTYDDAASAFNGNTPPPPPPPPPGAFGPNFSEIQASVFSPTCAVSGCHSGAGASASLNLESANSFTMLVGIASTQDAAIQRVNPGNPDISYLIQKLEGTAATGQQMPANQTPLAQSEIDIIRQWITAGAIDDRVVSTTPIRVSSLSPAPNANLSTAPAQIVAGFDRELDASTVNVNTFILEASGNDGTFNDGNEVAITAAAIAVPGANPQSATFDLTGVVLADDTYQVRLLGAGASVILDLDANALDGEFSGAFPSGNGVAGGDFAAQFAITTPVVIGPTLDQIQAVVFSPLCASCHGGLAPAAGLNLSNADTSHLELVGIASSQQAAVLRVAPTDPDNSYLIQKLEGAVGITGGQMPPGAPLPQSDIDQVRQWILDGALR